ncbi:MFS transporter [Paraburkholderia caribensis]|uniref:MFS transporter n=1 Tax=Paraburkholderia caribensis TaxID=75105 RepID=UPI00078DAABF|nr:MFS transporter [Paraburkholderia caribensis]AMV48478.1 hypothetical protein ATN79_48405 [Paraburkholderia caribensis]
MDQAVISSDGQGTHDGIAMGKVVRAALIGNIIEWFDYMIYASGAALVFAKVFFPTLSGPVGAIAAFGSFAVGSVARPLGGIILGHLGDRYGRRKVLLATVATSSLTTGLIGLLPGYDHIGVMAPVALICLRVIQGIAVAGEWAGAVVMVIESAPAGQRTMWGVILQTGAPIGTLLASASLAAMALLPQQSFLDWGWRIPFLFGFVLLVISVYLRWGIEETPTFKAISDSHQTARVPLVQVFREAPWRFMTAVFVTLASVAGVYLINTYMISYGTTQLGLSSALMLSAIYASQMTEIVMLFIIARWLSHVRPASLTVLGSILGVITAAPIYMLVDTKQPMFVVLAVCIGLASVSFSYAALAHLMPSLFPTSMRYSAIAVAYNVTGVFGSFTPVVATSVYAAHSSSHSLMLMLAVISTISLIGSLSAAAITRRHTHI